MFKDFLNSAKSLSRNPLGIIALFIALIYGLAILLLTFAGDGLTEAQKWPVVWFVVGFPVLVLIIFYILVTRHHSKLYSPKDFRSEESFLKTLPVEHQRSRLRSEIMTANAEVPIPSETPTEPAIATETTPSQDEPSSNQETWDSKNYLLAEDLALRYIERELGEPIKRQVYLGKRMDLAFDAATIKKGILYLVDVKLIKGSEFQTILLDALIFRLFEVEKFVQENFDFKDLEIKLILAVVVNLPEDQRLVFEHRLRSRIAYKSPNVELRVLPFDDLQNEYGVSNESVGDAKPSES